MDRLKEGMGFYGPSTTQLWPFWAHMHELIPKKWDGKSRLHDLSGSNIWSKKKRTEVSAGD